MSVPPPFQHPGPPPLRPELPEGAPPPPDLVPADAPDGLPRLGVPAWSPFLALVLVFFAVVVLSVLAGIVVGVSGGELDAQDTATPLSVVLTALQAVLLVTVPFLVVQRLAGRRPSPVAFGLRGTPAGRALAWTLAVYAAFWAVAIVVQLVFGAPEEQALTQDIEEEDSLLLLIGLGVLACVLAPVAEELFFRGFFFRALAERIPWQWAAVVSGAVFGLIHLGGSPAVALLTLGFFGVGLAVLFRLTRSLLPCIGLHAFNNAVSFSVASQPEPWLIPLIILGSLAATLGIAWLMAGRRTPAPATP